MEHPKESPHPAGTGAGSVQQLPLELRPRRILARGTKRRRILERLMRGEHLHCLTPDLHDTSLHSTVAQLQGFGLRIDRRWIVAYGYQRSRTHVVSYWLEDDQRGKARQLLD